MAENERDRSAVGQRSDYKTDETDLGDLRKAKYEVSIGLRQYLQRGYWSFAVTENVINFNSTPDVVFQLSLGFEL